MTPIIATIAQLNYLYVLYELLVHLDRIPAWFGILITVVVIISILSNCVLYARARQPWWAIFIPIYNMWVYAKIVGRNPLVVVGFPFAVILGYLLLNMGIGFFLNLFFPFALLLEYLMHGALLIYVVVLVWDLFMVFGASTGFGLFGLLFPILGQLVLLVTGHHYQGPGANTNRRFLTSLPWMDYDVYRSVHSEIYGVTPPSSVTHMHDRYAPDQASAPARGAQMTDWMGAAAQSESAPPGEYVSGQSGGFTSGVHAPTPQPSTPAATHAPTPSAQPPTSSPTTPGPFNSGPALPPFDPSA